MEQIVKQLDTKSTELKDLLRDLDIAVSELQQKYHKKIKPVSDEIIMLKTELVNAIESNRSKFIKPKSMTLFGVKWGLKKGKGKIEFANEKKTIELIKKHLPSDKIELLINTKETVIKDAIASLDATDVKKIGAKIIDSGEKPFITFIDTNLEKFINKILENNEAQDGDTNTD